MPPPSVYQGDDRMTDFETKHILEKCRIKEGIRTIQVEGYPIVIHPTLTLERSRKLVSSYCADYILKCSQKYEIFDARRIWKLAVICAYTDISMEDEIDAEMLYQLVYGTPVYDMLVGENGYPPAINMEQYKDLQEATENTLRMWLDSVVEDIRNGGKDNTDAG